MTKLSDRLLVVGLLFVLAPLLALFEAWAFRLFYGWFLAARYGAGPSYAEWYGIALITSLLVRRAITDVPKEKAPDEGVLVWALTQVLIGVVYVLLTIALAAVVRFALSWS